MNNSIFSSKISGVRTSARFDSSLYFDQETLPSGISPIARFVSLRTDLTIILGAIDESQQWRIKANLVMLGIVSGVESYFRETIRKILLVDEDSRVTSYSKAISYGAALYHDNELLPEALLEDCTFTSKKNIIDNMRGFLGISCNLQQNAVISNALDEYEKICQLRHCIAHRSGLLGSKNAIALGLDQHSEFLEKPIKASLDSVNNAFNICQNIVFEMNDFVFDSVVHRTVAKGMWTGNLTKDKRYFKSLFSIFSPNPSSDDDLKAIYIKFAKHYGLK